MLLLSFGNYLFLCLTANCQHADSSHYQLKHLHKVSSGCLLCNSHVRAMAPSSKFTVSVAGWYARLAAFDVVDLFARKRPLGPPRTLYVHESLPQGNFDTKGKVNREHVYATNQLITSKYNIVTFLPRNLLEQFRRIANMYVMILFFYE